MASPTKRIKAIRKRKVAKRSRNKSQVMTVAARRRTETEKKILVNAMEPAQ